MNINPTLDRVIIKKCKFEEIQKTSIILTNNAKNDINKYIHEVIEVGPGGIINDVDVKIVVKPGDKVIVPEWIGSEINIENENYRIVKQSEILAIIE